MRNIFQKKHAEYADLKLIPILVNSPKQSSMPETLLKIGYFDRLSKKLLKKLN